MLPPDDFIRIPYTPDLTQAGIAYACRSLPYTYDRMGGSDDHRLRRIVVGKAVELAFRRHLVAQNVPHDNLGVTPFTDPDHYDISLGGRRCDLTSALIFQKEEIRHLRAESESLLKALALVPSDQLASDHMRESDLYIFAFVSALVAARRGDVERALAAGQPVHFIHVLPSAWWRPAHWLPLGLLALESEGVPSIRTEVGGQGAKREFQSEWLSLPDGTRVEVKNEYCAVATMHVLSYPEGRVGIFSPVLGKTHIVNPHEWANIWVYGMDIVLAGYITRAEFRRRSRRLPPGNRILQYDRTRTKHRELAVAELHPLGDLFEQAKAWAKREK